MTDARNIFILGATGGIGSALSRRLVKDGHNVFLAARNRERVIALAGELEVPHQLIETNFASITAAVDNAVATFGPLDGAICCAGSLLLKPAHLTREDEWNAVLDANVRTAFALVSAASKAMQEPGGKRGGSLVMMASTAATIGIANHEAVAAAKGAIVGLTKAAAATYAAHGIRINCIAPGSVESPQGIVMEIKPKAPTNDGALGRISEIVEAAHWLLVGDSAWITGQIIGVEPGLVSPQSC